MKKINVYINGVYVFSTNKYKNCKELKKHLFTVRGVPLRVASVPRPYDVVIKDNDVIKCSYN